MRFFTDEVALFEEAGRFRHMVALRNVVTNVIVDVPEAELEGLREVVADEEEEAPACAGSSS
jgi:hypothetical protein